MHRSELVAAVSGRSDQPRHAVERAERQGRTPLTGEAMTVRASSGVRLSPVTALETRVEGR